MDAVFNAKIYPVGIGKHIVCIDADRKADAAIQTACRGEPRTPIPFLCGKKRYSKRNEIIKSEMSNILRKVRTKLKQTTKQKW